jgi:hypothetical protein
MERMTRQQMVAEFGEPGVQNATLIDLLSVEPEGGRVVLAMIERRPWGSSADQFRQIEEKINRYLGYVLDGFLVQHYPQYEGRPVLIRLDCAEEPHGDAVKFVAAAAHAISTHGLELAVNVMPPAAGK